MDEIYSPFGSESGVFRIIPEFLNYEIDATGVIRNVRTKKVLKYQYTPNGNAYVTLWKNGQKSNRGVQKILNERWGLT